MELKDIPQVSEIEREAFPLPWPATNFKRELTSNKLSTYLVAYEQLDRNCQTNNGSQEMCRVVNTRVSRFDQLKCGFWHLLKGEAGQETTKTASGDFIFGFAGLWFMADEAHLANIAVRVACRQRGIGEQLLISVIKLSVERKASFITLEVRVSNKAAQNLYSKYGFQDVGVRRGYYTDNGEDAMIMTVDGLSTPLFQHNLLTLEEVFADKWGIQVSEPSPLD